MLAWIRNIESPPRRKSSLAGTTSPPSHGKHPITTAVLASWEHRGQESHAPSHAGSVRSKNLSFGGVEPKLAKNQPKQPPPNMIVRERSASGRLAERYQSLHSTIFPKRSSLKHGHPGFSTYSKPDWRQDCRHSGQANYHLPTSAQKSSGKTAETQHKRTLSVDGFVSIPS